MKQTHSGQFGTPCFEPEAGDTAEELIAACREAGATYVEGPGEESFVVILRPEIGPELYSEDAVVRSLRKGAS